MKRLASRTRKIEAQHHSLTQTRHPKTKRFVKQRTNGNAKTDPASTLSTPISYGLQRILRPQARYNWLMPNIGAITPIYIETVLNGALAGNHVQQYELFDLMLRTWPELSACCQELVYGVTRKKLVFEAFHEEDEKPTPNALERSKLISTSLRMMEPDAEHDGNDLDGTIKNILDGWLRGCSVSEIMWQTIDVPQLGTIATPRTTFWVQPTQYAFSTDNNIGMRPLKQQGQAASIYPFQTTSTQPQIVDPFPPYKFLIAIHKAKTGSPLGGPLLVPLAWWWCAANFSADWLLNLAQVFGLPFRWANYDPNAPQATVDAICTMLQNMGSAGWAAFPVGTTLELHEPNKGGSDHSPQGELLDRADRYARNLILGQTMTGTHGTMGKGGGQAFGEVEKTVKDDRIDAAGKFAVNVINRQLVDYILMLNYGDTDEGPEIRFLEEEEAGLVEAKRDQVLINAGLPVGVDFMRKKYGIPEPAEDEELMSKPMPTGGGFGKTWAGGGGQDPQSTEDQTAQEQDQAAQAGDMPGHPFRGNQYSIGETVETPHGKGTVINNMQQHAYVSVNGRVRLVKHSDIRKVSKNPFPSITHSAEDERRRELNLKLKQINAIEDDAVFSRELVQLVAELK